MPRNITVEERFWEKVKKSDNCWKWTAGHNAGGWAMFRSPIGGSAHRFSYKLHKGKIPKGYEIDHLCRVRGCVNPEHLQAVTPKENILRSMAYSGVNFRKTHCHNGHPFNRENTYLWKTSRACKTCRRNRWQHVIFDKRKIKKTHCIRNHLLTESNVYIYNNKRRCKTCSVFYLRKKRGSKLPHK